MRIFWTANVYRTTGTPPLIRAAFPILLTFEDRKHVGKAPTLRAILGPPIVVSLCAAYPHHGIDAGAATKYVAEGHIEVAIVQSWGRNDGQVVIERTGDVVEP